MFEVSRRTIMGSSNRPSPKSAHNDKYLPTLHRSCYSLCDHECLQFHQCLLTNWKPLPNMNQVPWDAFENGPEDVLSLSYTWSSHKRQRQKTLRLVFPNAPQRRNLLTVKYDSEHYVYLLRSSFRHWANGKENGVIYRHPNFPNVNYRFKKFETLFGTSIITW